MKKVYDVTISLLTPLHIGSGAELQKEFDYVVRAGKTWVIHSDEMLGRFVDASGQFDERIIGRPASELLEMSDYQDDSPVFRYVMQGMPRSDQQGAALVAQFKDVQDRPFLPGSSVKGALRTVLAWHGFQEKNLSLDVNQLRGNARWVGQTYERAIFGRNPNYDLLRALHVADSDPQPQDRLQLVNAQVFTGGDKPGAPIELEAVRSDTEFRTRIVVDEFQHRDAAERVLKHGDRWNWLENLVEIAQAHGLERTRTEMQWYQQRRYNQVAGFYAQLQQALRGGLGPNRFLLQIGWGGGWGSKTIGAPLKQDQQAWERLLGDRRLSPARMKRSRGSEFPKSRRAVSVNETPAAPLGWCIVEMGERM